MKKTLTSAVLAVPVAALGIALAACGSTSAITPPSARHAAGFNSPVRLASSIESYLTQEGPAFTGDSTPDATLSVHCTPLGVPHTFSCTYQAATSQDGLTNVQWSGAADFQVNASGTAWQSDASSNLGWCSYDCNY
jgi:hypothetical protein